MLAREEEGTVAAIVIKISLETDGNAVGYFNHNKMLDRRIYDIMFMDRTVQQILANRIALSMYKHDDSERFTTKILYQFQRHRKTDEAIEKSENSKGRISRNITTKGYDLLTKFRDGSESWIPLADLKEYNPLKIAESAINKKL